MRHAVAKKDTGTGDWQPIQGRDGVWIMRLNKDGESHGSTLAVKYRQGYEVERSLHDGTVEALVLEGRWQVGDLVYGPGDYFCVPGGVVHGPERALTDVRLFVVSHGPLTPGP